MKRSLCFHALQVAAAILVLSSLAIGQENDHRGDRYLALGDSVSFSFITQAGYEYVNPKNFHGFPNDVSHKNDLRLSNPSCPGETSGSFLSATAPDNGCRAFRAVAPLHVAYASTQLDYATSFLLAHRDTRLVTIILGANDLFLLQNHCLNDPTCIAAGLPQVLGQVAINMATILGDLRTTGYRGKIVVLNYYSTDYTNPSTTGAVAALNQVLKAAATQGGALVADLFGAFETASLPAGGHTCSAGLLNALPQNQYLCDVHPSQSGHLLIARTIDRTLNNAPDEDDDR